MELRSSYLPSQAARYCCCSWAGKQPNETVFKPKTQADQGLGWRLVEGLFWVFEKVRVIFRWWWVCSGWIETRCYATAESTALLHSLPSILLKLEKLLPLWNKWFALSKSLAKWCKRWKETRDSVDPFPRTTFPSQLSHASDMLKLAFCASKNVSYSPGQKLCKRCNCVFFSGHLSRTLRSPYPSVHGPLSPLATNTLVDLIIMIIIHLQHFYHNHNHHFSGFNDIHHFSGSQAEQWGRA